MVLARFCVAGSMRGEYSGGYVRDNYGLLRLILISAFGSLIARSFPAVEGATIRLAKNSAAYAEKSGTSLDRPVAHGVRSASASLWRANRNA